MFKKIVVAGLLVGSVSAFGAAKKETAVKVGNVTCKAAQRHGKSPETQIIVELHQLVIEGDKAGAVVYTATFINESEGYAGVPDIKAGSLEGRDLKSEKYNGRKYAGYLKFDLTSKSKSAGSFKPESADLILSPEYKVIATMHEENQWDKSWNWDVETRQHPAVLATHFDDHHGDYIPMDCFSVAHVNDSKGKN